MGSFLSGIFAGSNPTLDGNIGNSGNIMNFGTAVGEGDIRNASDFNNTLLAGNPAETAKLLAPQIGAITGQGQQQKQTMAEFGNRSGGNNAKAQTIDDTTRAHIDDMISKLTAGAAAGDASLGTSTLGIGLNANQVQANESQQKLQNQKDSIFSQLINGGLSYATSFLPVAHSGGGSGGGGGTAGGGGGAVADDLTPILGF